MADTRFSSDAARIKSKLRTLTGIGRYQLSTPGVGTNPGYVSDPRIRIQGWSGTMASNASDVESNLRGIGRSYCRDNIASTKQHDVRPESTRHVPSCDFHTEESRYTAPAWERPALHHTQILSNPGAPVLVPGLSLLGENARSRAQYENCDNFSRRRL